MQDSNKTSKLGEIIKHDIEAAAFLIVAVMLAASVTSYAMDINKAKLNSAENNMSVISETNKTKRNPISVSLQDVNNDGVNDILLIHESGQREVVITTN